jgi:hypothetical protein
MCHSASTPTIGTSRSAPTPTAISGSCTAGAATATVSGSGTTYTVSVTGISTPAFWLGLLLIYLFYGRIGILPGSGRIASEIPPPHYITGFYTIDSLLTGNWRALLPRLPGYQTLARTRLDEALARGDLFVAYITTLPANLNINHAILVVSRRDLPNHDTTYAVYDPTFPDAPRSLEWSARNESFSYPPNSTFVGGRVVVWQVYGTPLQ